MHTTLQLQCLDRLVSTQRPVQRWRAFWTIMKFFCTLNTSLKEVPDGLSGSLFSSKLLLMLIGNVLSFSSSEGPTIACTWSHPHSVVTLCQFGISLLSAELVICLTPDWQALYHVGMRQIWWKENSSKLPFDITFLIAKACYIRLMIAQNIIRNNGSSHGQGHCCKPYLVFGNWQL